MTTRARDLIIREKALLRNLQANGTSGWIWAGSMPVNITINGTFTATVTVRVDNAGYEGPVSEDGPVLGDTIDTPAMFSTTQAVNWVRVDVTGYSGGAVNADLVAQ